MTASTALTAALTDSGIEKNHEALRSTGTQVLRSILQRSPAPDPHTRPPYIAPNTPHYKFAAFVLVGYTYQEACDELDLNPRTVERWRKKLCHEASVFFRRNVTYEFAARYVLDKDFRAICKTPA